MWNIGAQHNGSGTEIRNSKKEAGKYSRSFEAMCRWKLQHTPSGPAESTSTQKETYTRTRTGGQADCYSKIATAKQDHLFYFKFQKQTNKRKKWRKKIRKEGRKEEE